MIEEKQKPRWKYFPDEAERDCGEADGEAGEGNDNQQQGWIFSLIM